METGKLLLHYMLNNDKFLFVGDIDSAAMAVIVIYILKCEYVVNDFFECILCMLHNFKVENDFFIFMFTAYLNSMMTEGV